MKRVRSFFALVCALLVSLPGHAEARRGDIRWPQPSSGLALPGQTVANIRYAQPDGPELRIRTFDQQVAWQAGIAGMVFEVRRADGGAGPVTVAVEVDYSGFRNAFGGDYASRLNVVRMRDCAGVCGPPEPVAWRNDIAAGKITAELPAGPGGARFALTSMPSSDNAPAETQSGFIARSFRPCAEDPGGTNSVKTGDKCWGPESLRRMDIELPGLTGDLVLDDKTGRWYVERADGWTAELLHDAQNGDNDGEYWQVTSPQGTRFVFGANKLPGGAVTNSAWTVPVYGNHLGEPCWAESFDAAWCQQAYRWNLDHVVDRDGVAMSYFYDVEMNHYGRNNNEFNATPYTRAGYLARIEYLQRLANGVLTEPGARIIFTTEGRCATTTPCRTTRPQDWPDVPWDQACSAAPCFDRHTPVFFGSRRPAEVTMSVTGGGSWTFPA
ncbi:hypothetical protein JOF56_006637 [Kibdelosporangium banguiense]|uniref:Uncharacterized protein n=1 Tax=Kibdelosporangium banguiense TaxID=1365924 RepID=A0ABS4TPC6_9PSEU|nr:hypothetical protein [Kibdelosporangium banguiense]MBP2326252.1 hypothetical protein [Kibdelosporangium banguiense]